MRRVLVGTVGNPWMRDIGIGTLLGERLAADPPRDVELEVEDLSFSAVTAVLRLVDRRWDRAVLVGAERAGRAPGSLARRRIGAPSAAEVLAATEAAVTGAVELEYLAVLGVHHGVLPSSAVVVAIEPADDAWGRGLSPVLERRLPDLLDVVVAEVRSDA